MAERMVVRHHPPGLSHKTVAKINGVDVLINVNDLKEEDVISNGHYTTASYVAKMSHSPTKHIFAVKKVRYITENTSAQDSLRELEIVQSSSGCSFVTQFYGALFSEGYIWLLMEKMVMDTKTLYMKYKKPFDVTLLAYIIRRVLQALQYLYSELKVMHRDVKPANILVDMQSNVKVCDFGISGILHNSITKSNVGCSYYVAPERCSSTSEAFTIKADVWSLGITIIELADHENPFEYLSCALLVLQAIKNDKPPTFTSDYPPELHFLVEKCLQKSPSDRPTFLQLLEHEFVTRFGTDETASEILQNMLNEL